MTKQNQNANVNLAQPTESESNVTKIVAKVINVVLAEGLNRITFVTDKTFKQYNAKGVLEDTDRFRLNPYTAAAQLASFAKPIRKAMAYTMGKPIPAPLFNFVCVNGEIEIERTYHDANELREELDENGNQKTYGKPTYTTEIIKFTPNVDPEDYQDIKELLDDAKEIGKGTQKPKQTATQIVNVNPFI